MKRIRFAHEQKLRHLLSPLHPRQMDKALNWFWRRAQEMSAQEKILLPVAYHRIHEKTQRKLQHRNKIPETGVQPGAPIFWCDAGLGGLARWLRAAGYAAYWEYGIDDAELIRRAEKINAVILTTDSGMMERGVLRDGHLRSLWLPPALRIPEQLAAVFAEFQLERRPSRCPDCSGNLVIIDKEQFKQSIPPKTYLWLDEFWRCDSCGKLFWNGTHWRRLQLELNRITSP